MKDLFEKSIKKAVSYSEYRKIASELVAQGKTSGENTQDNIDFSKLNETRMNRLDKTLTVLDEAATFLQNLNKKYVWLVLSETWCGDAAQIVPIFNKMAEVSDTIDLKIVFRDENEALMNEFLTNGGKSIPKLIIIEKDTLNLVAHYGPRPTGASQLVIDYKAKHGKIDATIKENLQMWYLHDKGFSTQKEIVALMS
jgi:thiol-disulfide isomerase/thioredoxin